MEENEDEYTDYDEREERALLDADRETNQTQELTLPYKIARVATQFFVSMCFGAFSELVGPVLPELMVQTHSELETVAQSISMRGAGHAIGGIIGGFTVDRTGGFLDLLIAANILLYIIVGVWSAYIQNILLLGLAFCLQGTFESWLTIAAYRVVMRTWKEQSAVPMHTLIIGRGLGSIIIPQVVTPYIDARFSGSYKLTTATNISNCAAEIHNASIEHIAFDQDQLIPEYPAKFVKAYWLVAEVSFTLAVFFVIHFIHSRATGMTIDRGGPDNSEKYTIKTQISPRNCSPEHPYFAGMIVACLFFFYFAAFSLVRVFTKMLFSYARNGPCLSVSTSTAIESTYFVSLTVGRLAALLATTVIHMKYILMVEVAGVLISALILYNLHENITVLWVACSTLGFFSGPLTPTVFSWANRYLDLTSAAQMSPQIGAAVGELSIMSAIGYSFQNYGPEVIWTYQLALAAGICVVTITMQMLATAHGDRFGEGVSNCSIKWTCCKVKDGAWN